MPFIFRLSSTYLFQTSPFIIIYSFFYIPRYKSIPVKIFILHIILVNMINYILVKFLNHVKSISLVF